MGGKNLTLEVGRFAGQATSAVLARYGDTMVLATVVVSKPREDLDYFPLYVEYVERLYAGGRIKGSRWVKREGRPTDEAILTARLVDRSIRPLFPEGYKNEIQVVITVLSVDAENDADIPALCATSAALSISKIPWQGPIGAVRMGFVPKNGDSAFLINPSYQDLEYSHLDLIVSITKKGIIMLEGGAKEIPEETILKAIESAQPEIQKVIALIEDLTKQVGVKKQPFENIPIEATLMKNIEKDLGKKTGELVASMAVKEESGGVLEEIHETLFEKYSDQKKETIVKIVDKLLKKTIREQILNKGKRPDGRKPEEIRPIEVEVGILPRTHGSAMFRRGSTQVLTVTTLGSPSLEQLIENMEGEESKRYIHHYYMPPFSVGEVGRIGSPSRREIGHGALAEKALEAVTPSEEDFPYTIRLVSEIMSSNGSTSMASVCGSTLSLMDAGVPLKAPVSGIAMGLVSEGEKQVILSDIIGLEDFNGDMDFKVAGTKQGITAMQMDVKKTDLNIKTVAKILNQAKEGRFFILEKMLAVLSSSRASVSKFAPKIEVVHVPVEKIGEVIGPGGKIIRKIIAETGAVVDVEDDGSVNISSPDEAAVKKAVEWVKNLVREVKAGEIFEGTVKRIQPFGAFVEILPGKDGLVHVSRMSKEFVNDPSEVVSLDQKVTVRVTEIDSQGRINLSMILDEKENHR
ncbi:polyribonucleotide nucleotidyltransferase [Candidatus Shapirobacteria bacterium CG07_land_8_20_14_0_80_39_12]|uniref:Polyribonucleotide nucleotidyltransferase n=3 Tax=Microgenomates group TaxID=1794810 RepID=A0A2M6YP96_9BACT|nr:MAG: polyribonucleotide nucleotidyltransferase [Candidatus Shapirobacteria bacterium CG07_land_8_20_14_0_80_39_12]